MTEYTEELNDADEGSVSLKPLLRSLWSYRRVILLGLVAVVVSYVGIMLVLFARLPRERVATLQFQLMFKGADQDEYPNGTKFSSSEIVSTSILTEVFKINELQRYSPLGDFKNSMFVLQANRDIELLSYEYQTKLSDSKLTPVDRARIEEEFRRKRDSLKSAQYSLTLRRAEQSVRMPDLLLAKVLQDTLSIWAQQAAERKGAVRYDIPVLSKNVLRKDFLAAEDYIIAADILRSKIERILKTLGEIEKIPGALAVRMGPDKIGLADLRATVEDQLQFKVEPLLNMIRATGLSKNPIRLDQYFEGRLFDVQSIQAETTQRVKAMQDALRNYEQPGVSERSPAGDRSSVTPQLTESFIDRLVQLSTKSTDVAYRQDLTKKIIDDGIVLAELARQVSYYDSMRRSFSASRGTPNAAAQADVVRRTAEAFDELARAMDQIEAIYGLISQQNLNPDTVLYTTLSPVSVLTVSSLSIRTIALYFLVTLFGAMVLIPLGCLAHAYFRHWISPRHQAGTNAPPASGTGRVAEK